MNITSFLSLTVGMPLTFWLWDSFMDRERPNLPPPKWFLALTFTLDNKTKVVMAHDSHHAVTLMPLAP